MTEQIIKEIKTDRGVKKLIKCEDDTYELRYVLPYRVRSIWLTAEEMKAFGAAMIMEANKVSV